MGNSKSTLSSYIPSLSTKSDWIWPAPPIRAKIAIYKQVEDTMSISDIKNNFIIPTVGMDVDALVFYLGCYFAPGKTIRVYKLSGTTWIPLEIRDATILDITSGEKDHAFRLDVLRDVDLKKGDISMRTRALCSQIKAPPLRDCLQKYVETYGTQAFGKARPTRGMVDLITAIDEGLILQPRLDIESVESRMSKATIIGDGAGKGFVLVNESSEHGDLVDFSSSK